MRDVAFRRPAEADHARIVGVVDEWWGGRRTRHLLPRLWIRHFARTSWLAETADGRLAGFLVGFISPGRPGEAVVHLAGTSPNLRRRGLGRALYERFFDDARAARAQRVACVAWPGDRGSIAFHRALGFHVVEDGATPIYGTPAFADYDDAGEDRAVLERGL